MANIVGYDPDKDYLLEQREPEYVCKCSDCGNGISEYEFFVCIPTKDDPVYLCEKCSKKIQKCMVTAEEIIYE